MSERSAEGYDIPAVEAWMKHNVEGLEAPCTWTRLPGGHSNLTYRLDDANGANAVIRRPPQGQLLPKAHDMSREWALICALENTPVPVAKPLGFCESPDVTGAWFYVMSLIDGRPLYRREDTEAFVPTADRQKLAYSFFDVLADLHSVDPDEVGLSSLGKKENYIGRQLNTWYRSWNASVEPARMDDQRAHDLQQYFQDNIPQQGPARVVHGDYGLHNCLVGSDSTIVAVLDWEISTLGDPLADLAYALNTFPDPNEGATNDPDAATAAEGFPGRAGLAQRYAQRTGRNLDLLDYYIGFNSWKSAAIIHGVYARYMEGKKSSEGVDLARLEDNILGCLAAAERAVNRLESQRN